MGVRAVVAMWLLAASLLGCQFIVMGPGNAVGGVGVFEPELRYANDKLYATIIVPPGFGPIDARLIGPGAPSAPLSFTKTCDSLDDRFKDNAACAFDLPHDAARAGAYTIEVSSGSTKLQALSFMLISVPGAGGSEALIVDPSKRRGVAYVRDKKLYTWLPIDASYESREVTFYIVTNGVPDLEPRTGGMAPRYVKGAGDAAVDLAPSDLWIPDLPTGQREDESLQVVAFVGHQRVGSWGFGYGYSKMNVPTATTGTQRGDAVVVNDALVDPGLEAQLEDAQKRSFAKTIPDHPGNPGGGRHPVSRYEKNFVPRICAVFSDKKALALVTELNTMRAKGHGATATENSTSIGEFTSGGSSYDVSVSTGSGAMIMGLPRWENGLTGLDTWNAITMRGNPDDLKYGSKLKQLDVMSARYGADCMTKIVGAIPWLLSPPANDEGQSQTSESSVIRTSQRN